MTRLLKEAFTEASKLSDREQDVFAQWLLEELTSEQHWGEAFAESREALARLADEALSEERSGHTQVLEPDRL